MIVDSNERGFTKENIKAISQTAESTKKGKINLIGEKGIGFKSVFRVARKVHIQSEPFSFAFIHEDNDNGLGMVTPLNEAYLTVPPGVQTRMILYLRHKKDFESTKEELRALPNTLLLFLKKLKRLEISIKSRRSRYWTASYSLKQTDSFNSKNRLTITRLEAGTSTEYHFWIKKRTVDDMPNHEARPEMDQAEVALAFPLDRDDRPIMKNQWISAYLPVREEGFTVCSFMGKIRI